MVVLPLQEFRIASAGQNTGIGPFIDARLDPSLKSGVVFYTRAVRRKINSDTGCVTHSSAIATRIEMENQIENFWIKARRSWDSKIGL